MFKAPRRALSALALLAAIGCGDDGGSEPEGSISVSASPTALSVPQGGSGTITVTLTRGGGFAEPVTVTVEGLPAGVTASVAPTSLTETTTQAVVTVTVGNSVAALTYTSTIRASAAGIGAATTTYTLTVTPQANYALAATAASVVQGATGTSTISIQRTNFAGEVALTLENPPAGITGTFNPSPTTANQSVLTINVASTVAPGPYTLNVKGSATGQGDKTTTVALTVTAAPVSIYTLSVSPGTLNINAGEASQSTLTINRTNFPATVNLALDAPPAGITATFNPAAATGVTSIATISVAANVTPGPYTLTLKGTAAGSADKTTTLAVTVTAPPASNYTLSVTPTTLNINAGGNSQATVNIARTNFVATVTLTLDAPPAGITATFNPAATTGNTSTATINVAANVAPGNHPLIIKGTAPGVADKTTTLTVNVAAAGTFTITSSPTTLPIAPGANASTTITIARTNLTADVALSLVTPPTGITGTFTPAALTGTTLTSTLQINVAANVAPNSYPVTVQGVGGSVTQTTTVNVTVAGGGQNIVWEFCNADGVPLKFWRLSGGTWSEVSPTVVGSVTRFSFTISGTQGGIAYTTQVTSANVRTSQRTARGGTSFTQLGRPIRQKLIGAGARLTNQTGELLSTYFETSVTFALTSELTSRQRVCTTPNPPAPVTKTFTVSGMAGNEVGFLGYGDGSASLTPATTNYPVSVTPGTYDWLASFGTPGLFPGFADFTHYRLGRGEIAPGGTVAINRTGATAFTTMPFTITGAAPGSFNINVQILEGARGPISNLTFGDPTSNSGNLLFLAPGDRLATDMNILFNQNAEGVDFEIVRGFIRFFGPNPPASTTFALPANIPAFTMTPVNGAAVPTWSVSGQIPSDYQGTSSAIEASFQGAGETTLYFMTATQGWLTANNMSATYTLTGPTLPGFLAQWAPAAPLVDAQLVMASSLDLFVGTVGTVVNFAIRFVSSP